MQSITRFTKSYDQLKQKSSYFLTLNKFHTFVNFLFIVHYRIDAIGVKMIIKG